VVSVTDPSDRISLFSRQEPLRFYQVAPHFVLTRLSAPRSRPTTFFSGSAGNRTRASGSVAKPKLRHDLLLKSYSPTKIIHNQDALKMHFSLIRLSQLQLEGL
jgi:hypothetical protein